MAFIRCPKCNSILDSERKACPICGYVINKDAEKEKDNFPFDEHKVEDTPSEVEEAPAVSPVVEPTKPIETPKEEATPRVNNNYYDNSRPTSNTDKAWIKQWADKPGRYRRNTLIFLGIFTALTILFAVLFGTSEVTEQVGNYEYISHDFAYLSAAMFFGFCAFMAIICLICSCYGVCKVEKVKGYDVVVFGYFSWKLIIEGTVVDQMYGHGSRYNLHPTIKLSGRLPDDTLIVATVEYGLMYADVKIEAGN